MFKKKYRITLDVRDEVSRVMLSVRKGDRQRVLMIRLSEGREPYGLPDGCYAVFNARRSDGAVYFGDCAVCGDVIVCELDGAIATVIGRLDCDVTVYSAEGDVLTSPRFGITVYAGATTVEEIEGSDGYRTLGELVTEARVQQKQNSDFAGELEELKGGIADELAKAGKTIEGFNTWYEETAGELEGLSDTMEQKIGFFDDAAGAALSEFRTEGDKLLSEVALETGEAVSKVEQASRTMQNEVSTKMAEFTSVGTTVTVPAGGFTNDADIERISRITRVSYRSRGNTMTDILLNVEVTDEWTEFSAPFVYDNDEGSAFILRFRGGPSALFIQPYDIADVRIFATSDPSETNIMPSDIADLNWTMDVSNTADKLTVAFEDGLKYIHVFRQSKNTVMAVAFTGIKLNVGEEYVLKVRMRKVCRQYICSVPLDGIRAASSTAVVPCRSSAFDSSLCGIRAFGQRIGELFFTADTLPDGDLCFDVTAVKGEGGVILNAASSHKGDGLSVYTGSYVGDGGSSAEIVINLKKGDEGLIAFDSVTVNELSDRSVMLPIVPHGMLISFGNEVRTVTAEYHAGHSLKITKISLYKGTHYKDYVGEVFESIQTGLIVGNRLNIIGSIPVIKVVYEGIEYVGVNENDDISGMLEPVARIDFIGSSEITTGNVKCDNELNRAGVTYHYVIW